MTGSTSVETYAVSLPQIADALEELGRSGTIALFVDDYKVPLLPPEVAAYIAVTIELTTPVLLVLGLAMRPAAIVLLGMTAVIEIFVYPLAWPTHIQWAAMLLVLLCRGAGKLSVDHMLRRHFAI